MNYRGGGGGIPEEVYLQLSSFDNKAVAKELFGICVLETRIVLLRLAVPCCRCTMLE